MLCNGVTATPMRINEANWGVYDFGATVHLLEKGPIFYEYHNALSGGGNCLAIHPEGSLFSVSSEGVTE